MLTTDSPRLAVSDRTDLASNARVSWPVIPALMENNWVCKEPASAPTTLLMASGRTCLWAFTDGCLLGKVLDCKRPVLPTGMKLTTLSSWPKEIYVVDS